MSRIGLSILCAVLLSGNAFAAPAPAPATPSIGAFSRELETVATRVAPAVVEIAVTAYGATTGPARVTEDLLGRERRGGSGFLISSDGYIVTNFHVVQGARRLLVLAALPPASDSPRQSILKPTGRWIEARIVGVDRETDLAVLKIEQKGLPHLAFGDSDKLKPGQVVLAYGSPLGLENSVTMGVVSSVARQLEAESPMVYLQTDAPINPGNSGGPLLNLAGEVVGVNTLIMSKSGGSEGIGFAAPSNIAKAVSDQIRADGRVRRGQIGVSAQTITPVLAKGLGLPRDWGVVVADVEPGGPGARAGVQPGDVVAELNGKAMENGRQFEVNLYRSRPGQEVYLTLDRAGKRIPVTVTVIERKEESPSFEGIANPDNLIPKLGVLAADLSPDLVKRLPWLRDPTGVLVAARAADAPFIDGGLQPGDVVVSLNRVATPSIASLRDALAKTGSGGAVVLQVNRMGQLQYVAFEME
ncbi:MAG TPA: trypsin-like peptidase domain-containing protein [Candidatus Eisenbacteria bacterium]|nr:trypsin-like peptidase domain-containing protein [Candidatus Eisenbacteria bacterium]